MMLPVKIDGKPEQMAGVSPVGRSGSRGGCGKRRLRISARPNAIRTCGPEQGAQASHAVSFARWIGARLFRLRQKPMKAAGAFSSFGLPELTHHSRHSLSSE